MVLNPARSSFDFISSTPTRRGSSGRGSPAHGGGNKYGSSSNKGRGSTSMSYGANNPKSPKYHLSGKKKQKRPPSVVDNPLYYSVSFLCSFVSFSANIYNDLEIETCKHIYISIIYI